MCVCIGKRCSSFWRENQPPTVRCTWLPAQAASRSLVPCWESRHTGSPDEGPTHPEHTGKLPRMQKKKVSQDSLSFIPCRLWIGTDLPFFSHGICHLPEGCPILLLPSRCVLPSGPECGCSYSQHLPALPCFEPNHIRPTCLPDFYSPGVFPSW